LGYSVTVWHSIRKTLEPIGEYYGPMRGLSVADSMRRNMLDDFVEYAAEVSPKRSFGFQVRTVSRVLVGESPSGYLVVYPYHALVWSGM
jgi:hypothetical protein